MTLLPPVFPVPDVAGANQLKAAGLPQVDNPADVRAVAKGLVTASAAISDHASTVRQGWQALRASYHAPEQELAYAAMNKPAADAAELERRTQQVNKALQVYAGKCAELQARRAALAGRINSMNAKLGAADAKARQQGQVGSTDPDLRDLEKEVLSDMEKFWEDLNVARVNCANQILLAFGKKKLFVLSDDPRLQLPNKKNTVQDARLLSKEGIDQAAMMGKLPFGAPSRWTVWEQSLIDYERGKGMLDLAKESGKDFLKLVGVYGPDEAQAQALSSAQSVQDVAVLASPAVVAFGGVALTPALIALAAAKKDSGSAGLIQAYKKEYGESLGRMKQAGAGMAAMGRTRPNYMIGQLSLTLAMTAATTGGGAGVSALRTLGTLARLSRLGGTVASAARVTRAMRVANRGHVTDADMVALSAIRDEVRGAADGRPVRQGGGSTAWASSRHGATPPGSSWASHERPEPQASQVEEAPEGTRTASDSSEAHGERAAVAAHGERDLDGGREATRGTAEDSAATAPRQPDPAHGHRDPEVANHEERPSDGDGGDVVADAERGEHHPEAPASEHRAAAESHGSSPPPGVEQTAARARAQMWQREVQPVLDKHGWDDERFDRALATQPDDLAPDEVAVLKEVRASIQVTPRTRLAKVLQPGVAEKLFANDTGYPVDSLIGFVTRQVDIGDAKRPVDLVKRLALTWKGNPFIRPNGGMLASDVYHIEFNTQYVDRLATPQHEVFRSDGDHEDPWTVGARNSEDPLTGNGFTAGRPPAPEWEVPKNKPAQLDVGAQMFRTDSRGVRHLVGELRETSQGPQWVKVA